MINPNLKTTGTILTMFDGDGKSVLPFYSARGATQTMTAIGAAKSQRRTVNFERPELLRLGVHRRVGVAHDAADDRLS